ncbi:STAS domain-containing protein [Marinitenerispora sediminis]|uniref:Anti-sigma factor antagonist n=1 Tax=Marinitenerispora sediminis TaxID=1931232 RepID=A0A368T4Y0_9ACTN|nr:STAS domain-containing protein [Marinitenerispora sediminis]RCV57286.1 anti-sigma factor antagonist [Marinitenerispora sediminis]RCV58282.1 anti-sigma factor antagonist [Marinitenerispora sediminis]RCV58474.1 anti-sigma factor antagonist [Marinitenerispora sediminis]
MHRLGLNTRVENHSVIVQVEGELDIATAGDLQEHVLSAIDAHGPWLILDFSRLDFMDSSGLNAVINGYRAVKERGGSLALAAPNERVTKVVRLVGLHRQVPVHRTVAAAVIAMEALEAKQQAG